MFRLSVSILVASLLFASCRPEPIEIEIPQEAGKPAISSVCLDPHTVSISASYTLSSLQNLQDTSAVANMARAQRDLLVDSGLVTITQEGGAPQTLHMIAPGFFGRRDLNLVAGALYTLTVRDYRKGTFTTATTTFIQKPSVDTIFPERLPGQTAGVKLTVRLKDVQPGSYYFMSYRSGSDARDVAAPLPLSASALQVYKSKQIELFSTANVNSGSLERSFILDVKADDTLVVQIGRVDKAHYDYLDAYKRSGALINQLSGEPINLPTNIKTGFGFFSLFEPVRKVWYLNQM